MQETLLDPVVHENLIRELDAISLQTGVPKQYLYHHKAKDYCTEEELAYVKSVKKFLKEGYPGAIFITSVKDHTNLAKTHSVAATLIRNFVDARVIPFIPLIKKIRESDDAIHEASVILIPDLGDENYIPQKWELQIFYGWLLQRFGEEKMVIGFAETMKGLNIMLGSSNVKYFKEHYQIFEGNCTKQFAEIE